MPIDPPRARPRKAVLAPEAPSRRLADGAPANTEERPSSRPYGGMSGEDRRAERRARFVEAGIKAFGRDGFRGTTTRSVCAEAGLTQRYFYESFKDLEALFIVVANTLGARLRAVLIEAEVKRGDDPRAVLHGQLTRYFELLKADPNGARIVLLEVYTASTRVGELAMRFTEELGTLVGARIKVAFPNLAGPGIDAKLVASALVGAVHHLALRWMLSGYREPIRRVVDTAAAIFMGAAFAVSSLPSEPA